MSVWIDHVVWGVADLDRAAGLVGERFGLASVPGGRHPGWGTGNRIIPLGGSYLELMAVLDPGEAAADPVGKGLATRIAGGDGLILWCLGTDDLDAIAARLGLSIQAKSRVLPDGVSIGWRSAGLAEALASPSLPFFIDWHVPADRHPGRMAAAHRVDPEGIAWVEVGADQAALAEWLDGASLPVRIAGPPGVNAVGVATAEGELRVP